MIRYNTRDFKPDFDPTFFKELARRKIEEWKLDDKPRPIYASYESTKFEGAGLTLKFSHQSFSKPTESTQSGPYDTSLQGILYLFNTKETYEAASLSEIYNKEYAANQLDLSNVYATTITEFADLDLVSLRSFVLVMFADLKAYIFRSRFMVLSPDPQGITSALAEKPDLTADKIVQQQSYKFNELGPQAHNAGFFTLKEGKIVPTASISTGDTQFGFFDGLDERTVLNSQLLIYLQVLQRLKKHEVDILVLKDFMAKRTANTFPTKNSFVLMARVDQMVFTPRTLGEVEESVINLKAIMDEKELSAQAVDLNIKLMRWRQLETLDLDLLHGVKVLLLGAGTLGCQLARNLIGWGIKHITFVDYGKVSHSNPVRQSLYNFRDVVGGGKPKAETAAAALKKIQPTIVSEGYSLQIPMPGHHIREDQKAQTLADLEKLDELIQSHDAVMLLLDTREARWLPTVISAVHNKICFSVALGFDNFIVIRHGMGPLGYDEKTSGKRPGCYFCNDYLSPTNTMKDRSLDQQCTVTRPGLSFLASAYASELLVNFIHLRQEDFDKELRGEPLSNEFGLVPQHIRGTASGFNVDLMTSEAYENCLACGSKIVQEYKTDRQALVLKALAEPSYLQNVSGITEDLQVGGDVGEIVILDEDFEQ